METKVNGEINHETTDHEVHVTQAEVNHESHEIHEPVALKRNIMAESESEDKTESMAEDVNTTEEVSKVDVNESKADPVPVEETSESFMKIEERNVIERLSKVIDTQLTLEVSQIDNNQEVAQESAQESTHEPVKDSTHEFTQEFVQESAPEVAHQVQEPEASDFKVEEEVNDSCCCKKVSENEVIESETQANEVRLHSFEENSVKTENHIEENERILESEPRVVSEQAFVPEVPEVKQNGTKVDVNQNRDEEEDEFTEVLGFKNKLKMWSSGKKDQSSSEPIDSRNKFKTLRQIKKGNTRSLMEKFQFAK